MKPRIYVFSIGEATTDICVWALERYGFEVVLWNDPKTLLWEKLRDFYNEPGEVLYRCDADIIPNKNCIKMTELNYNRTWWWHSKGWGWYRNDLTSISIAGLNEKARKVCAEHIDAAEGDLRPETAMSRLPEFFKPRRFNVADLITGIHGYGQFDSDVTRVRYVKHLREQDDLFDWKLFDKVRNL